MLVLTITESIYIFKEIKSDNIKNWYNKADKVKYIVILSTMYLAISHVKLLPFFAISAICFMYEDFYKLIENIKLPHWKNRMIYIILLFISILHCHQKTFQFLLEWMLIPSKKLNLSKQTI